MIETNRVRFDGPEYIPYFDEARLTGQLRRIYQLMKDGEWRTLQEISSVTGDPQASVSAQLRHLRKERFGCHTVLKQHRGDQRKGLWEYQLIVNHGKPNLYAVENLASVEDPHLIYTRNEARLRRYVNNEIWVKLDNRLRKQGYFYLGDGVWKKTPYGE